MGRYKGSPKTGGMLPGYKYTKKRYWWNNGEVETLVWEDELVPEGFVKGRLKSTKPVWNKGLTKYNDPTVASISKSLRKNSYENYEGTRTDYILSKFSNKDIFIDFWNTHTCKECIEHFNLTWDDIHLLIDLFGLENPKQHTSNIKDYIFDESFRERQSKILKGKNTWSKGKKVSQESIEKQKFTYSQRTEEQRIESKLKEYETRKLNGTLGFHKTSDEKELESILFGFFGEDNVKYNYFDKDRYPFKCDFYIPSEDLFIELHAGWEHQGHPFDNSNLEDISILEEIKSKQNKSEYYSNVIYQWTELDVRKLNTFKENNLNYIIGYSVGEIYEILKDKFN
jgi:hypothetical protein